MAGEAGDLRLAPQTERALLSDLDVVVKKPYDAEPGEEEEHEQRRRGRGRKSDQMAAEVRQQDGGNDD